MADEPVRPFKSVTLGNLLAAIPAVITMMGGIVWATTQGNINEQQTRDIIAMQNAMYTKDEAAAGRERRDAQVKGLQDNIAAIQAGINSTINLMAGRMDRAFERLDKLQDTVTEVKTTLMFFTRQQARNGNDSGGNSYSYPPSYVRPQDK